MLNKVILTARVATKPIQEKGTTRFRVQHHKNFFTIVACGKANEIAPRLTRGELIHIDGSLRNKFEGEKQGGRCYSDYIQTFFIHIGSENEN